MRPAPLSFSAGPGGYYRGMRTKIVQSVLAAALLFVCKEKITDATRDVLLVRLGPPSSRLLIASHAGLVHGLVIGRGCLACVAPGTRCVQGLRMQGMLACAPVGAASLPNLALVVCPRVAGPASCAQGDSLSVVTAHKERQ